MQGRTRSLLAPIGKSLRARSRYLKVPSSSRKSDTICSAQITMQKLLHFNLCFALISCIYACASRPHRSEGCGKPLPEGLVPGGHSQSFELHSQSQVGGVTRRYLIYLPERFSAKNNKASPLIVALHGQTQPTTSMESVTNLSVPYFNQDAIVVYPEGLDYKSPGVSIDPPGQKQ